MISFVIPAHNEELWIEQCLRSIHSAMRQVDIEYEVIVVNDASTDRTTTLAVDWATVIDVNFRKISAVRNAGARVATGNHLFFIDADTTASAGAIRVALEAMHKGAVGGGCVPTLSGPVPWWGHPILRIAVFAGRTFRIVGGCFLFCTHDAFQQVGGFSECLYAGEDIAFVTSLKKLGRFVVPKESVATSSRKLSVAGPFEVISLLVRIAIVGQRYQNPWVIDLLYGQRASRSRKPDQV